MLLKQYCVQVNKTFFSPEINLDHISMMSFSSQRNIYYLVDLVIPLLIANWIYENASNTQAPAIQG